LNTRWVEHGCGAEAGAISWQLGRGLAQLPRGTDGGMRGDGGWRDWVGWWRGVSVVRMLVSPRPGRGGIVEGWGGVWRWRGAQGE